jgi:hypothetical protein
MVASIENLMPDVGFIAAQANISASYICSSEPTTYASANLSWARLILGPRSNPGLYFFGRTTPEFRA